MTRPKERVRLITRVMAMCRQPNSLWQNGANHAVAVRFHRLIRQVISDRENGAPNSMLAMARAMLLSDTGSLYKKCGSGKERRGISYADLGVAAIVCGVLPQAFIPDVEESLPFIIGAVVGKRPDSEDVRLSVRCLLKMDECHYDSLADVARIDDSFIAKAKLQKAEPLGVPVNARKAIEAVFQALRERGLDA